MEERAGERRPLDAVDTYIRKSLVFAQILRGQETTARNAAFEGLCAAGSPSVSIKGQVFWRSGLLALVSVFGAVGTPRPTSLTN
jgi:hypothetical protein